MKILVTGASGKTGRLVVQQLINEGHTVVRLIRKEEQAETISAMGATALIKDINDRSLYLDLQGMDSVIFVAAGSTGHYQEVDHRGVENLVSACEQSSVSRFILISALGAHDPNSWGSAYKDYLQAKADGEEKLRNSNLQWTIIRPGSLNDQNSTELVHLSPTPGGMGSIPRIDLAKVAMRCLTNDQSVHKTFELYQGNQTIDEAINSL